MSERPAIDYEPPTLARLNALLAPGYRIDHSTSQKVRDAIWFDHPGKARAQEPTLILYPSGLLVSDCAKDPKKEQLRFNPEQEAEFRRFVAAVPKPSLWERSYDIRANAIAAVILLGVAGLIWAVVSTLLTAVGIR